MVKIRIPGQVKGGLSSLFGLAHVPLDPGHIVSRSLADVLGIAEQMSSIHPFFPTTMFTP